MQETIKNLTIFCRDNIENLQLLCGSCNSIKGDRNMAYLLARLKELGIVEVVP